MMTRRRFLALAGKAAAAVAVAPLVPSLLPAPTVVAWDMGVEEAVEVVLCRFDVMYGWRVICSDLACRVTA